MPTDLNGTPTALGIGTYDVNTDAPSGLGFNEAMAQIDALIAARVGKPAGIQVNDVPVWNGTTWVRPSGTPSSSTYLRGDGSWAVVSAGAPTGSVTAFAGSAAPSGWSILDGTARKRSGADPGDSQDYSALFALLSTTYGVGDGSTTFNLPDTRGRVIVAKGTHTDVSALANSDGLTVGSRRPKHKHSGTTSGQSADHTHLRGQLGVAYGTGGATAPVENPLSNLSTGGTSNDHTHTVTVGPNTGSEPTDTVAYLVLLHIIKL